MIEITLSFDDKDITHDVKAQIEAYMENELFVNPNLPWADIAVSWGDHTCVNGADAIVGAQLLAAVHRIIDHAAGRVGDLDPEGL